jgi:hypothetical protein
MNIQLKKRINFRLILSWLCVVCALATSQTVKSQTTIFSDSFDNNIIDANKWTISGYTIQEINGMMRDGTSQYILQPGPSDSKDIWTTSHFSYAACSSPGPGGGLNDFRLRVGGWGDSYYSLLQFDLTGLPTNAISAVLYLYCENLSGGGTPMYLDQITQAWDWRTSGTGCDHDRLWWADKPSTKQWLADQLPTPTQAQWYAVNITALYNAWQNGTYPNYGLQFRPVFNDNNNFDEFYSGDYANDPTLRPKLVIIASTANPFSPRITAPPQSQTSQVGSNLIFSVVANGALPFIYQWQFNGQNIPNATNATLTLNSVTAANSGGYSVVVSNPYGSVTSATASLAVMAVDTTVPCYLMTVTPLPPRQNGMNNLVVVTHGMQPAYGQIQLVSNYLASIGFGVDISWITNLCSDISNQLTSRGSNDWQVVPYSWVQQAGSPPLLVDAVDVLSSHQLSQLLAKLGEPALDNAEKIGTPIGQQIAAQGWSHVHLIAHSAGAGLIQAAANAIRSNAPNTVIQTTFLDPFLGVDYRGLSKYGANADWSDNYFTHDSTGSYTEGVQPNAYNVDVTWVDPNKTLTPILCGSSTADSTVPLLNNYCNTNATSSHGWPIDFYTETVLGTETNCAIGYGFLLSMESGGWNNLANYHEGYAAVIPCGQQNLIQNQIPIYTDTFLQVNSLPYGTSEAGVILSGGGVNLNSVFSQPAVQTKVKSNGSHMDPSSTNSIGTPSWIAVGLTITNAVNFIQFDAGFTDTNASEGLLTVYWNTNQIGTVDERVVNPGLQTYRFVLPGIVTNGIYTLGFRLDTFTNVASSVTVTNVATGFFGVTTPLTLGITLTNSTPILQLTSASNYNYLVESSINLVDWTPMALLMNSNGTVLFTDPASTNSGARFYRAVMP